MKKNVLFIVATPYQLLVAMKILLSKHKNDSVDLLISDSIVNVEIIYERILKLNLFHDVKIYRINKHIKKCNEIKRFFKVIRYKLPLKSFWDIMEHFEADYSQVYLTKINMAYEMQLSIIKKNSKDNKVEFNLFEDGFETYTSRNASLYSPITFRDSRKVMLKKIIASLMSNTYASMSSLHVFSPEILEWEPTFPVYEVERISSDNTEYLSIINEIFDCEDIAEEYDKDVIFFEEGYYADGNRIDDIKPVAAISDVVGKENVMIKIHPRNPINRFEKLGYKTNKNTAIPWEVIALNIALENKILVTIASQAVLTILLNLKVKPKQIIMLMNCDEFEGETLTPGLPVVKKLALQYSEDVMLPNNFGEIEEYLPRHQ